MDEKHFNAEPWFVVDAATDAAEPYIRRFKSREVAINYAMNEASRSCRVMHVFRATRTAAVHPQPAKVYDEGQS